MKKGMKIILLVALIAELHKSESQLHFVVEIPAIFVVGRQVLMKLLAELKHCLYVMFMHSSSFFSLVSFLQSSEKYIEEKNTELINT